jgi:hypothetical protein
MTYIGVFPERVTRVFDLQPLFNLPECLDIMFKTKHEKSGFIDYKAFFRMSLMFHDDVVLPFLTMFQDHLERIQVAWVSWLMEEADDVNFLETTFGVELDLKATSASKPNWC